MLSRNDIIGQKDLLDRIDDLIDNGKLPNFIIFVGGRRSGKTLISNYIADRLGCTFIPAGCKIDDVRNIIDMSYSVTSPTYYHWKNADTMSVGAKNALLKITEEPASNAHYCMTLNTVDNMLPTILSRGTTFFIQPYTIDDFDEYSKLRNYDWSNIKGIVYTLCSSPGELDTLNKYNMEEFIAFANKILDNIGIASIPNALKLANNFSIKKDETDKYDVQIFLNCIMSLCMFRYRDTKDIRYNKLCIETCNILSDFKIGAVNKLAVLDRWLLTANSILK